MREQNLPVNPADSDETSRQDSSAEQADQADHIIRATALNGFVRAFACRTTQTCRTALQVHGLSPVVAAALGRLMSGVLMLTQDLSEPGDSITAIIRCEGEIEGMTVIGEQDATVRGTVLQPVVKTTYHRPGKLDVGAAIGKGTLTVVRDMHLKEPYVGRVELVSGEIAEDLVQYLAVSEQIPTILALGVKMDKQGITHAGGLMVQLMPGADDSVIDYLEKRAAGFPEITGFMEDGFTPAQIMDLFLGDPDIRYHTTTPCGYACPCSRERMEHNLIALGHDELAHLAAEPDGIELICHFCGTHYKISRQDVENLLIHTRTTEVNRAM